MIYISIIQTGFRRKSEDLFEIFTQNIDKKTIQKIFF